MDQPPSQEVREVLVAAGEQRRADAERWHQSLKADCIRPGCSLSEQDAARLIERFVNHYNAVRLHSAIGYVTPADRLAGRHLQIFSERDHKLELARQNRQTKRQSLTKSHYCFD
jgi:transposase InsO family protein